MITKNDLYLLRTIVQKGSAGVGSFCSLRLLSWAERERDGGLILEDRNHVLLRVQAKHIKNTGLVLCSDQSIFGVRTRIVRKLDDILSKRIIEYLGKYYGKYRTNCSTLVEYLRTGIFAECDIEKNYLMFSAGMNHYQQQKIEPGDSLCVFYFKKEAMSRKAHPARRNHCRENKKYSIENLTLMRRPNKAWNLPPGSLHGLYRSGLFSDYHFMFCIGIDNGNPIWIHQLGRNIPEDPEPPGISPSLVISIGMHNLHPSDLPACMFIKKGRG